MTTSVGTPVGGNLQSKLERDDIHSGIPNILLDNKETREEPIPVFRYETQLYRDYFGWFLNHTDEKKRTWDWFSRELLPRLKTRDVLIDALRRKRRASVSLPTKIS